MVDVRKLTGVRQMQIFSSFESPFMSVTFTGIDERTDLNTCEELCADYPVEFGMLFGSSSRNPNRYPCRSFQQEAFKADLKLALHLCKDWAVRANSGFDHFTFYRDDMPLDKRTANYNRRFQINYDNYRFESLNVFANQVCCPVIVQHSGPEFPKSKPFSNLHFVYDCSKGNGIVASEYPRQTMDAIGPVGYAGGINPDNVVEILRKIDAYHFWIDMETGVRDSDDWFSIEKCRRVCEAIWG